MQPSISSRPLITTGLIIAAIVLGAPLSASAETVLNPAVFRETLSCQRGPRIEGLDLGLPETIGIDYSTGDGQSCVGEVSASAFGPMGDVQVNNSGTLVDAAGSAYITYWFAIDPLVADAPDTPVSVTTQVLASASIQGAPVLGGSASAYFQVDIPDPLGPNGGQTYRGTANVCGPDLGDGCPDDVPSVHLSLALVLMLPPNTPLQVNKEAGAGAGAGSVDNSVGAQAVVDPMFAITPGFLVDYNGVPTAATDLYKITYSPGVTPVPAPAAGWLALTGFSLLGLRTLRRRASRANPASPSAHQQFQRGDHHAKTQHQHGPELHDKPA